MNCPIYLPDIDINKKWKKTLLCFFRLKKKPSDAWVHQYIKMLNNKYNKYYKKNPHYYIKNPYYYEDNNICVNRCEVI